MKNRKKIGQITTLGGVILGIYCLITIDNDMEYKGLFSGRPTYTYQPPYTDHEANMIMLCIVAAIAVCVGLYFWFAKKEESDS